MRFGDLVQTLSNGLQPIRWIGSFTFSGHDLIDSPRNRPIRIAAGALGQVIGPNAPALAIPTGKDHALISDQNDNEEFLPLMEVA